MLHHGGISITPTQGKVTMGRCRLLRPAGNLRWRSAIGGWLLLPLCAVLNSNIHNNSHGGRATATTTSEHPSRARIVPPKVLPLSDLWADDGDGDGDDIWTVSSPVSPLIASGRGLVRPSSFLSSASSSRVPPVSLLLEELDRDGDAGRDNGGAVAADSADAGLFLPPLRTKKTGTTIAGCVAGGGTCVVLAADTRATDGTMVADKACSKIHPLATNAWCCGAGTSADLDKLTRNVLYSKALECLSGRTVGNGGGDDDAAATNGSGEAERGATSDGAGLEILHQRGYDNDRDSTPGDALIFMGAVSIDALCVTLQDTLFESGGGLGANLVLGGVWEGKAYLRAIHPHGSMDVGLPFAALGSGGLAALGVLEEGYRPDLTLEEAVTLVQRAISSGIRNDLGSGSQVDLCVIYPNGTSRHTRCAVPEEVLKDVPPAGAEMPPKGGNDGPTSTGGGVVVGPTTRGKSLGVNGFGNMPFAIESTKQRVVCIETSEERRRTKWNKILGVPDVPQQDPGGA